MNNTESLSGVSVNQEGPSYGQKAVSSHSVSPAELQAMEDIAAICAKGIDNMNNLREASGSGEQKALATIAIRDFQQAKMRAVQAITWKD